MPLTGAGDEGPIPRSDTRAIRDPIPKTRDFSQWVAFGEKVIVGVLATLITKCLMWLTTGIGESPLGILISIVGGVGGLILFIYFQRYVGILGAGAQPEGSPERQDYDELRQSLVEGGEPARMYARLLTGFLDTIDRFFGDAGKANQTLFPRVFGLKTAASLWTAPALDRCLLLALVYPIATIFVIWVISGHVGPAERALHLESNLDGWQRAATAVMIGFLSLVVWRSMPVKGWKSFGRLAIAVIIIFVVAGSLYVFGVFIGSVTLAVAVVLAFAVTSIFSIATAGNPAGVVAVASIFPLVFTGALVFTVPLVFTGALVFTVPLVSTNALALAGALAFVGAVTVINKIAIQGRWQGVFLSIVLPAMIVACFIGANLLAPLDNWGEVVGPMLLFLGLLTLLNAPFDWASLGLTRALLRRGLECGGWWPYVLALVDAVLATIMIAGLAVAMVIAVQTYDRLAAQGGGACILLLDPLFNGIAADPTAPQYWWIYALLLSSMIPSLINLMIGATSLLRGIPCVSSRLLDKMRVGEAVPTYDRRRIAFWLTLQIAVGAILGIAAQLGMLWVVIIGYFMPHVGNGLFGMSRYFAREDLPMQVWQRFGGGGVANCAEFDLKVDALSNCFDIRSKSIPSLASAPICTGGYVVDVKSTKARFCSVSKCFVPKVMIYVTTNDNPQGWFNIVEQGHSTTIDVNGVGTDANKVYAFYIDITCGDNTGDSTISFRRKE